MCKIFLISELMVLTNRKGYGSDALRRMANMASMNLGSLARYYAIFRLGVRSPTYSAQP